MSDHRLMLIQTLATTHSGHPDQPNRLLRDATGLPVLRASTVLGALRKQMRDALYTELQAEADWKACANQRPELLAWFGQREPHQPGHLQASPAQLLFLPVRAVQGLYAWVTSVQVLKQLAEAAGADDLPALPNLGAVEALCAETHPSLIESRHLMLEELGLNRKAGAEAVFSWLQQVLGLAADHPLFQRLVILSEQAFGHFMRYAMVPQVYHQSGQSGPAQQQQHLETLPPQSWLYARLSLAADADWSALQSAFPSQLSLGSHRTTGSGLCSVSLLSAPDPSALRQEPVPVEAEPAAEETVALVSADAEQAKEAA